MRTVEGYTKKFGFCCWQAQDPIERLDAAQSALELVAKFFAERAETLGGLSAEAKGTYDRVCAAIAVCKAD